MFRRFLKDSFIYGFSGLLSRGIGLLMLPLYTRALSPTDYGRVDLLLVVRSLVAFLVTLEIGQAMIRFYVETADEAHRRLLASTALWFTAGAYAVFGTAALVWAGPLSRLLLDTPAQAGAVRVAVGYMVAAAVFQLMQDLLRFELKAMEYARASILSALVVAGTTAGLVLGAGMGISGVFWGLIAGNTAGAAYSWHAGRGRYGLVFRRGLLLQMLAFSAPLVASSVAEFVAMFIDRMAIRALMTVADVGVYGVAARFAAATSLVVTVQQASLLPLIYNRLDDAGTPAQVARILRLMVAVLGPAIAVLGVFAPEMLAVVTAPGYLGAAPVIPVLAASVFLSHFWTFAPGLGIAKRTRSIAALNVAAAVLNTGLNFALIPWLGIGGAALATLVSALCTAAGYQVLGARHYRVPHALARLLAAAGVCAAAVVLSYARWGIVPAAGAGVWAAKAALCLAAAAATAALLVRREEAAQIRTLLARARAG